MKSFIVLCFSFVCIQHSFAIECPIKYGEESYIDKVSALIKSSKNCEEGASIAEACAFGASGDGVIAPVAERKCGLDFWKKLTKSEKAIYNGFLSKCDKKYSKSEGSINISATAFCHLSVARFYSNIYSPIEN